MELAIEIVRMAIQRINEPRLFQTERGDQGALISELTNLLQQANTWLKNSIEQEYQKRAREHGLRIRPDIIIHIPYERGMFSSREEGNFIVIELKRRASRRAAFGDFEKLEKICEVLKYPIGMFLNIDSEQLYLAEYLHKRGREHHRKYFLYEFAVRLAQDTPVVREQSAA